MDPSDARRRSAQLNAEFHHGDELRLAREREVVRKFLADNPVPQPSVGELERFAAAVAADIKQRFPDHSVAITIGLDASESYCLTAALDGRGDSCAVTTIVPPTRDQDVRSLVDRLDHLLVTSLDWNRLDRWFPNPSKEAPEVGPPDNPLLPYLDHEHDHER